MSTAASPPTTPPGPRRARHGVPLVVALAVAVAAAGCGGSRGSGAGDEVATESMSPNRGPLPTLAGGVDLGQAEPATVLVGDGLAFGTPLPSEVAAAAVYTEAPEVRDVLVRRVYATGDARHLGEVVVLVLDGSELFDEAVLAAFVEGAVEAAGGGPAAEVAVAGRPVLEVDGPDGRAAAGFRERDLLVLVTGAAADVDVVVQRQLEALASGVVGSATPVTPLAALPVDAPFVDVPTVSFVPFLPPEEEDPPEAPSLPGAVAVSGRYGVVAGERRTVVWSVAVDPGSYPSAEALEPALRALVAARAGGTDPTATELGDRVVYASMNEPGEPSAQAFRHGSLVLLVEGIHPDQLDAVTTAWLQRL